MPTPAQLAAEIQADPVHLGYVTAQDDAALAALLNAPNSSFTANNPLVPLSVLGQYVAANDLRRVIEAHVDDANQIGSICLAFRDLIQGMNGPPFDTSSTANQQMLGALVQANLMTAAQQAAILALGNKTPASRAEVLWGPGTDISHGDIRVAMGRG